jgi:5'-nucleotidase
LRITSITPIHVDLTRFQALEQVASWVGGLAASLEPQQAPHQPSGPRA